MKNSPSVGELLLGPAADDHLERLLPHRAGFARLDAEALHLGARPRAAGAELEPSFREDVDRGRSLGDPHRVVVRERQQTDAVPDPDVLGSRGDRPEEDPGSRRERVLVEEVVLDAPHAVEPELIRELDLLKGVLERGVGAVPVHGLGTGISYIRASFIAQPRPV